MWLSWKLLAQGHSGDYSQAVDQGFSHLKAGPGLPKFTHVVMGRPLMGFQAHSRGTFYGAASQPGSWLPPWPIES